MGEPVYEAIRRLDFADFSDQALMLDVERFLRSFVYESFNRDAVVAAALEASFTSTRLFAPMIDRSGVEADLAGNEALSIVVGDVGALPWETVLEFRDHNGSQEARHRLREFERLAVESEPRDAYDFMRVNRGPAERGGDGECHRCAGCPRCRDCLQPVGFTGVQPVLDLGGHGAHPRLTLRCGRVLSHR